MQGDFSNVALCPVSIPLNLTFSLKQLWQQGKTSEPRTDPCSWWWWCELPVTMNETTYSHDQLADVSPIILSPAELKGQTWAGRHILLIVLCCHKCLTFHFFILCSGSPPPCSQTPLRGCKNPIQNTAGITALVCISALSLPSHVTCVAGFNPCSSKSFLYTGSVKLFNRTEQNVS